MSAASDVLLPIHRSPFLGRSRAEITAVRSNGRQRMDDESIMLPWLARIPHLDGGYGLLEGFRLTLN